MLPALPKPTAWIRTYSDGSRILRARIWATYKPGQEVAGTPSASYLDAAKDVQAWIAAKLKEPT